MAVPGVRNHVRSTVAAYRTYRPAACVSDSGITVFYNLNFTIPLDKRPTIKVQEHDHPTALTRVSLVKYAAAAEVTTALTISDCAGESPVHRHIGPVSAHTSRPCRLPMPGIASAMRSSSRGERAQFPRSQSVCVLCGCVAWRGVVRSVGMGIMHSRG